MFRGWYFWRVILTTCITNLGAPFIDNAFIRDYEDNIYSGKVFLLMPWKKNEFGEHISQRAFVVGWQKKRNNA